MRKVYTLTILAVLLAFAANAQRTALRLRYKATSSATSTDISTDAAFRTPGNWFYKNGASWTAISAYPGGGSNAVINSDDTLEIVCQEIVIKANITLNAAARIIELVSPRKSGSRALIIDNGFTLTMANTNSIFSIKPYNGELFRLRAADGSNKTKLVLGSVLKAINGSATSQSFPSNLAYSAYASAATSVSASATTFDYGGFLNGALPVVLVSFDAVKQNNSVNISWSTQQEYNTNFFQVERSFDGANYQPIAKVAAAGNSTTPRSYSYADAAPARGIAYYRVRIVDLDGKVGFTTVKAIRAVANTAKVSVYPNPAISVANIVVNNTDNQAFSLNVFNRNGQLVSQKRASAGTTAVALEVSALPAGDYIIDVNFADGSRQSSKLLVGKQ